MCEISLPSGVNSEGRYVHISQVNSGQTQLKCPYCDGLLTAKKGRVMVHHFAHTNESCLQASQRDFSELDLLIYDRFNLYISAKAWEILTLFHESNFRLSDYEHDILSLHTPPLIKEAYNPYHQFYSGYELSNEGKIPFGEATLQAFADFQLSMIFERHYELSDTARKAYYGVKSYRYSSGKSHEFYAIKPVKERATLSLIDLNIYRSQVHRLFSLDLYLLKIIHADGELFKIGVSSDVKRRIPEIERELEKLYDVKKIEVDRLLKNRGAVERYAQHRYREFNIQVGNYTEYFQLDKKMLRNVRSDFTRLGDFPIVSGDDRFNFNYDEDDDRHYTLPGLVSSILGGELAPIEQIIKQDEYKEAHKRATIEGMQRAKESGVHVGRPSDTAQEVIAKYPEIVEALEDGKAIKTIARELRVSKNTVKKVKKALE